MSEKMKIGDIVRLKMVHSGSLFSSNPQYSIPSCFLLHGSSNKTGDDEYLVIGSTCDKYFNNGTSLWYFELLTPDGTKVSVPDYPNWEWEVVSSGKGVL